MSASVTGCPSNKRSVVAIPLLAAALTLLGVGGAARAADPNDAKVRYVSGQSHYNLNEFAEALQDFKEAYRLRPDPAFLFNIAQCERQLGNLEEAIKFYRSYLRNKPDAGNKREIEKKIEELKGLIEAKKKATTGAPQSVIPPAATGDDQTVRGGATSRPVEPPAPPAAEPPPGASPPAATTTTTTTTTPPAPPPVTPPPASASSAPSQTPGVDLTAHPTEADAGAAPPIYKRWWFWAGAGAAVLVVGVIAAVAMSGGPSPPASGLGNQRVF